MIDLTEAKTKPIEEATEGDILHLDNDYFPSNDKFISNDYWLICRNKDSNAVREYSFEGLTKQSYKLFYPCTLGKSLPDIFNYFGTKNITIYDGSILKYKLNEEGK